MEITEESQPTSKSNSPHRRFGSFRLYLNVFCIVLVSVGLWQAVVSAWANVQDVSQEIDNRLSELQGVKAAAFDHGGVKVTKHDREIQELQELQASLFRFDFPWLFGSAFCVGVGIVFPGMYWFLTLRSLSIRVPWSTVSRAYYVGNLGKYVPGKAMVLILRATALKPFGASVKLTTISVFVETLTTIAVGAAVGALIVVNLDVPPWLQWMGVVTALCAITPTLPMIFRPILKFRLPPDDPLVKALDEDYNHRLMAKGWLLSGCSWLFLGTSLYCTVLAIPIANAPGRSLHGSNLDFVNRLSYDSDQGQEIASQGIGILPTYPLQSPNHSFLWITCVAACALSVVAGFVSMLPGGAGVRELVLMILLSPIVGSAGALVVAIVHRLVTIAAELFMAGISVVIDRYTNKNRVESPATASVS